MCDRGKKGSGQKDRAGGLGRKLGREVKGSEDRRFSPRARCADVRYAPGEISHLAHYENGIDRRKLHQTCLDSHME